MTKHDLQGALSCCGSACWLRMAATRLFPGRAIRDAPRLLDTSEAWTHTKSDIECKKVSERRKEGEGERGSE